MKNDTLMVHTIGANTATNAARYSHNSVQGHHHSSFGIERYADASSLRWSMTVGCLLDPKSPAARYASRQILKRPVLGCGMILGPNGNFLIISDLHLPYQHRDAFAFLAALKKEYKFKYVLNVGDVFDHHRGSYHESETDAHDEETEYRLARKYAKQLQVMFPHMVITQGNHDMIPKRKLKTVGLSRSVLKDYNQMYDLKDTWKWVDQYQFNSLGGFPIVHPMVLTSRGRWDKVILRRSYR